MSTAHFHVQLLGGFAAATPDGTVSISARKDRWLLAKLLLAGGRPISRQEIQDALWPHGGGDPAFYLRRSLSQLRDALGPQAHRIESPTRTALRFAFDKDVFVDALAFEVGASSPDPERWRDAVSLYTGALLPDCHETWVLGPRQRLHRLHHERVARLAKAALETGDVGALEPVLLKALEIDPLWEEGRRLWMRALVALGQPHEAVRNFQDLARLLHRESPSQEPEPETLALAQQIRSQARQPIPHSVTPHPAPLGNLPESMTRCIGREREIAQGTELLATTRLLTLTGAGGSGKTRLSQEIARRVVADFPDGVWWVELAPIAEPELVARSVAALLEVKDTPGEPILTTLVSRLKSKRLLLVLDNCEHLLDSTAAMIERLLRGCPGVTVLASSREPIKIVGETAYRVPSLTETDAAQLFQERAAAVQTGWTVPDTQESMLALICRRLDGIPLAIELAAARVRSMTLPEIERRLDDRFAVLTGGSRTAPARHQTLHALIDWSVALLTDEEQVLLRRLSVFAGGWTAEAAEAVCGGEGVGSALDGLTSLADKSLVVVESDGESTRFHFLETVRQFAQERLCTAGEVDAIRRRHLDHFIGWFEAIERNSPDGLQPSLECQRRELDNARAALDCCEADRSLAERQARLVIALLHTWLSLGRAAEGRGRFQVALEAYGPENRTPLRSQLLIDTVGVVMYSWPPQPDVPGDYMQALAREALAINVNLGDELGAGRAYHTLGWCSLFRGDYEVARESLERALEIRRRLGENLRGTLTVLTMLFYYTADFDAARRVIEAGRVADPRFAIDWEARILREEGELAAARQIFEASVRQWREGENVYFDAFAVSDLALLLHGQGEFAEALDLLRHCLRVYWEVAEMVSLERVLEGMAALAWDLGRGVDAVRLWGASEALRERHQVVWFPIQRLRFERQSAPVRASLGEDAFAVAWEEGWAMTLDDAVGLALR